MVKDESTWGTISRHEDNPLSFATAQRESELIAEVREAVARNRTVLAYQPVVVARDTETVAFYEGFIRVLDRTGRIIPAQDFIDAVESTETGRQIDCLALQHGLLMLNTHPDLRLAVNMSARSIGYLRWSRLLDQALRQNPKLGERLILEITERSAIQVPELVCGFMTSLQQHGVSFALDDFGSGFTSFRYLRDFYFDILKIDGGFIRGVAHDVDSQVIATSMIALATEFGMLSVAEHVENAADADWLVAAGVDCMQGYHYGAPHLKPAWMSGEKTAADK